MSLTDAAFRVHFTCAAAAAVRVRPSVRPSVPERERRQFPDGGTNWAAESEEEDEEKEGDAFVLVFVSGTCNSGPRSVFCSSYSNWPPETTNKQSQLVWSTADRTVA